MEQWQPTQRETISVIILFIVKARNKSTSIRASTSMASLSVVIFPFRSHSERISAHIVSPFGCSIIRSFAGFSSSETDRWSYKSMIRQPAAD